MELPYVRMSETERGIVARLNTVHRAGIYSTISDLAAFDSPEASLAVRNGLRRLVRGEWVDRGDRGQYRLSAKGKRRLLEAIEAE